MPQFHLLFTLAYRPVKYTALFFMKSPVFRCCIFCGMFSTTFNKLYKHKAFPYKNGIGTAVINRATGSQHWSTSISRRGGNFFVDCAGGCWKVGWIDSISAV
jgi:hypothetical protein